MWGAAEPMSLLLAPTATGTLLCDFHDRLPSIAANNLTVAPTFDPTPKYEETVRRKCKAVRAVTEVGSLSDAAAGLSAGDWLLLADPLCFPAASVRTQPMLGWLAHSRSVIHLVAMNENAGGSTDRVHFDRNGLVRGIPRYYDGRTWSYLTGVVGTLLPVGTFLGLSHHLAACRSLTDFRSMLATEGVPSRDLPIAGEAFHLEHERELLRLSERTVLATSSRGAADHSRANVHPSARILGPVTIHDNVTVEQNAVVIGPTVLGANSRVEDGAVVSQCVIGANVTVPACLTVGGRAIFSSNDTFETASAGDGDPQLRITTPLLEVTGEPGPSGAVYPRVKDLFDRAAAALGLVVLSPLLAFIAALIKLDSRGPILYADLRETQGGRQFRCWKFRTMRVGAAAEQAQLASKNQLDGPQFKMHRDPRITRIGVWLRKISLDELPQLLNVVAGSMSLVGPRPSPFRENQICVPWREARLSVRAGITGLWQVSRDERKNGDFHQWIHYDLLYVRNCSWSVDLKILLATVWTLGGASRVPASWIVPELREKPVDELAAEPLMVASKLG
jgi:lipopolysaccharide/colanic/teichoic acid biosynthesis glycosyltransferase